MMDAEQAPNRSSRHARPSKPAKPATPSKPATPATPAGQDVKARLRWTPSHTLIGVFALLFFFGPAIAAGVGVRATAIENRKLTSFPSVHDGWSVFGNFDSWATDHLPLRDTAIRTNTTAERDIFREDPNYAANGAGSATTANAGGVAGLSGVGAPAPVAAPTPTQSAAAAPAAPAITFPAVVGGTNGWLYYGTDFADACQPVLTPAMIAQRFQQLSDIITKAGKKFVMTIAPDKSDVYPQYIPNSVAAKTCTRTAQNALWAAMAAHPPTGYFDVHTPIVAAVAASPQAPIYYKTDTHWDNAGSLIYARLLANSLNPSIWSTSIVKDTGLVAKPTDLSALLGTPKSESQETYSVTRPGVHNLVNNKMVKIANTTTNAPLLTGTTALISDSFTEAANFAVSGFFSSASIINPVAACTTPACLPKGSKYDYGSLESIIKGSRTVVLEIVERDVVGGQAPILSSGFLTSLASALGEG
jgi:alginate O-acetyltransferase complex protein AlgJ